MPTDICDYITFSVKKVKFIFLNCADMSFTGYHSFRQDPCLQVEGVDGNQGVRNAHESGFKQ